MKTISAIKIIIDSIFLDDILREGLVLNEDLVLSEDLVDGIFLKVAITSPTLRSLGRLIQL